MPYINIRATKMNVQKVQLTASEVTNIIQDVLNKGLSTIMVDIEKAEELYLGGKMLDDGAMIQIQSFWQSPASKKEEINTKIVEFMESKLGIPKENIYISFTDKNEWGV